MNMGGAIALCKAYRDLDAKAIEVVDYLYKQQHKWEFRIMDGFPSGAIASAHRWIIKASYSVEKLDTLFEESEAILKFVHEYRQKRKDRWKNGGFALVVAMFVMLLLLALGISLAVVAVSEMQSVKAEHDYIQAFNYAEAGIEYAKVLVREKPLTDLLILQHVEVPPPGNGSAFIMLEFKDNYDETPDDQMKDEDCRIRLRSVAFYPHDSLEPATAEIRARTESESGPCADIKIVGWEEVL